MKNKISYMKLERDLDLERREVQRLRLKVQELQAFRYRVKELEHILADSYVMPTSITGYLKKYGLRLADLSSKVSLFLQGEKDTKLKRKDTK